MNAKSLITSIALSVALSASGFANAGTPITKNGVTTVHLDEYNGYY